MVVHWLIVECDRWVVSKYCFELTIAPVSQPVACAETVQSQVRTQGESKKVVLLWE